MCQGTQSAVEILGRLEDEVGPRALGGVQLLTAWLQPSAQPLGAWLCQQQPSPSPDAATVLLEAGQGEQ